MTSLESDKDLSYQPESGCVEDADVQKKDRELGGVLDNGVEDRADPEHL